MKQRPFKQVDVFTATPYRGNPLAVVLDGTGLSDEEMQHFAQLDQPVGDHLPAAARRDAGADYRVRIFTPGGELPFAGHPTLGSCHAWLEAGGKPRGATSSCRNAASAWCKIRRDGDAPGLRRAAAASAAPPSPGRCWPRSRAALGHAGAADRRRARC